ncbi:MAG: histidine kinase [Treponema sp.]|jgi:two-component system sensor histidine kinase YesM|nr:histidine kinase [Treponema sp.]
MQIRRVSHKIFLGFLALSSMILMIMSIVVMTSYASSLKRNEINSLIQASTRTREQFDFIMGIIDDTARIIGSRPEVIKALTSDEQPPPGRDDFSMNVYLQSLKEIQPFLGNISIAGDGGQFQSSNVALKRVFFEDLYRNYEHYFNSGMYKSYFVDTYDSDFSPPYAPRDILTGVWPIYNVKEEKLLGQLYMGLNYSLFQEMFILTPTSNNEKILLIDPSGRIIYHYPAFISFDSVLADYPELITADEIVIEGKVFDTDSFIVSQTSGVVSWRFIKIADTKYITADTLKTQRFFTIVFIISIIIILIFSIFMSHILTKPVKLLFDACKRIESGDLSFRVAIRTNDEMGQLGHTFNLVMDQINANLERELIEQKRQNELKLEILRSQINPHFLYNTLDSIKFLANLQEIHNIASMCSSLINLLKYNLSSSTLATLGEEVESVGNYVGIQKYRYGDIFEFKTEITKETEHCEVSRFILQPLVENCLIHGFDDIESGGKIIIRSAINGEILCLEVINNGNYMDRETLDKVNRGMEQDKPFSSIGINNIRERIRLQFGDQATLIYSGGTGMETVAYLRFPVRRYQPVK